MSKGVRSFLHRIPKPSTRTLLVTTGTLAGTASVGYFFSDRLSQIAKTGLLDDKPVEVLNTGTITIGGPFRLRNTAGQVVTEADLQGRLSLIYFGFTNCPDVCPEELEKLAKVLERLRRSHPTVHRVVQPVFVSVDPGRDTLQGIQAYLADFTPDGKIVGWGALEDGNPASVKQMAKAYRAYFAVSRTGAGPDDYLVDHSTIVYMMGPDGKFIRHFGKADSIEDMVKVLVKEAKERKLK